MSAIDELRRASFNGVPFFVSNDQDSQDRAVVVKEYAGTDRWSTEDQGLKAYHPKITAYVARMSGVRAESYALWQVCTGIGIGLLVLPHSPGGIMRCTGIQRSYSDDKIGYVAFALDFVGKGDDAFGISSLLLPSQAASAFVSLTASLAGLVSALPVAGSRAASALRGSAAEIALSLERRMEAFADPDVRSAWREARPAFVGIDPDASERGTAPVAAIAEFLDILRISDDPEAAQLLVDAAAPISALALGSAPDRAAAPDVAAIAIPDPTPMPAEPRATSRRAARAMASTLRDTVRALAAAAYARRAMQTAYDTRNAATVAREALSRLIDPILDGASLDEASFADLATVQGLASGHLVDVMTGLKPIVRVETTIPLTASLLAWQLYGDTSRADELVARNAVAEPCFMPLLVESLAP